MGMFSRNKRSKNRKEFAIILETFTKAQNEVQEFMEEKVGHIKRIDREMKTLATQKSDVAKEQTRAKKIAENLASFLGDA